MSRRPVYMRNKNNPLIIVVLLMLIVGLVYKFNDSFSLQYLVENSELNGRSFTGNVEEIVSPNSKIKSYFMQQNEVPIVAISFMFANSGSAYDEEGKKGIASLLTATIKDGTLNKSADVIRDEMGAKGIAISFGCSKDSISGSLVAPKENLNDAVAMLRDILIKPKFERKYLEVAKAQVLKALDVEKETPAKELALANDKLVFGTHEYANNPLGNKDDVVKISQADLREFVKNKLAKDNLYVGVAGDLTGDDAGYVIDEIFGKLPDKNKGVKVDNTIIDFTKPVLKIKRDDGQNIVIFTMDGTCRKCDDFYPLYVANYIFGGAGLNSKLNQKIREKEGLTYGGYSSMVLSDKANLLTVGFSTTKDNFEKAVSMFKSEWKNYADNGFSKEDVDFAKDYLIASYNLRFASVLGIADMLVMQQKFDLGLDFLNKRNEYVNNVTVEEVNKATEKYFTDKMLQAQIGTFN